MYIWWGELTQTILNFTKDHRTKLTYFYRQIFAEISKLELVSDFPTSTY
jgi:hypothetical protein